MTKDELITLAVGYGWEYREKVRELCKGRYYFNLNNLPTVVLRHFDGGRFTATLETLSSLNETWIIGNRDFGWFSLKANRFVR